MYMSLLDNMIDANAWDEFRQRKVELGHCSHTEIERLDAFIEARGYEQLAPYVEKRNASGAAAWFGYPEKHVINKQGTSKKRVVFSFPEPQTTCLKMLAHLLYRYDAAMSPACYSFRRGRTAKDAWSKIMAIPGVGNKHVLKADIRDYFNSIDTRLLMSQLVAMLGDDPLLLAFFEHLLCDERAYVGDELQECRRGAMAGVPVSAFMANVYLKPLDDLFCEQGVEYSRYSDDILVFADSLEQAQMYLDSLKTYVTEWGLQLNDKKTALVQPGQPWDFLGFKYANGRIDLSDAVVVKTKAKIKRKARALYRWRKRKGVGFEQAARTMVRIFDAKFYDVAGGNRFTWTRWFFPVLTSTKGLAELDRYLAFYLRYLKTGRHSKANYRVTRADLSTLGYTSLVSEYRRYRKDSAQLRNGTYRSV